MAPSGAIRAHSVQTHSRLAAAALKLLEETAPQDFALIPEAARICVPRQGGSCVVEEVTCIPQAVVDEDKCEKTNENLGKAPFVRHFFNPKTEKGLPGFDSAAQRAAGYWAEAKQLYRSGEKLAAFDRLGHVMHLLQDMTSPAHIHDDPHVGATVCIDVDDFESWGYCLDLGVLGSVRHSHILEYIDHLNDYSGTDLTDRMKNGLTKIFGNQPIILGPSSSDSNTGYGFVRRVANKVYNFSTFGVRLKDTSDIDDPDDGAGELERMFPSLQEGGAARSGWTIDEIGFSHGDCDAGQNLGEWWLMKTGCNDWSGFNLSDGPFTVDKGDAYIENTGGGGSLNAIPGTVFPKQYDRSWFRKLRGSKDNTGSGRRSMLQIYGDVLYPAAVVYSAGLIQAFLDEVVTPPIADAGGHYSGEACVPVTFDASGSQDRSGQGLTYEWDFDDDGLADDVVLDPLIDHAYTAGYNGLAVLQVTDVTGLSAQDAATVEISPDLAAPQVDALTASPPRLWPVTWRLVPVDLSVSVTDQCPTSCRITGVEVDDSWRQRPARFTQWDVKITGDLKVRLRSKGYWRGRGRVYVITVECVDASGNVTSRTVEVPVSPT